MGEGLMSFGIVSLVVATLFFVCYTLMGISFLVKENSEKSEKIRTLEKTINKLDYERLSKAYPTRSKLLLDYRYKRFTPDELTDNEIKYISNMYGINNYDFKPCDKWYMVYNKSIGEIEDMAEGKV